MTLNNLEILDDNTLRIETILSIGGMQNGGSMAGPLDEAFSNMTWEDTKELFPEVEPRIEDASCFEDALIEWLLYVGHVGMLVQYATPCMRPSASGGSTYSWGSYYTKWFYGSDIEATISPAVAWAEECRRKERKGK